MVESSRTKLIKKMYSEESSGLGYEIYNGFDDIKRIRTYILLNEPYTHNIKLEELGIYKEIIIKELESLGYIDISSNKMILKK